MKRFFAAESAHGSATSHGFANDWNVYVFSSRAARDKFVAERKNLSTVAIPMREATKYAANYSLSENRAIRPNPFDGEFWGIIDWWGDTSEIEGCIGILAVCHEDDPGGYVERLYRR